MASPEQRKTVDYYFNEINGNSSCIQLFVNPETEETEDSFRKKLETGLESVKKKEKLKELLDKLLETDCGEIMGFNNTPVKIDEIKELLEEPDYNNLGPPSRSSSTTSVISGNYAEPDDSIQKLIDKIIKLLQPNNPVSKFVLIPEKEQDFRRFLGGKYKDYLDELISYIKNNTPKTTVRETNYASVTRTFNELKYNKETKTGFIIEKAQLTTLPTFKESLITDIIALLKQKANAHKALESKKKKSKPKDECLKEAKILSSESKGKYKDKFNETYYILKPNSELFYRLSSKKVTDLLKFKEYLDNNCDDFDDDLNKLYSDCYQKEIAFGPTPEDTDYINEIIKILEKKKTILQKDKDKISSKLKDFKYLTHSENVISDILVFLQNGEIDVPYDLQLECRGIIYNKYSEIISKLLDNPENLAPDPPPPIPPPPFENNPDLRKQKPRKFPFFRRSHISSKDSHGSVKPPKLPFKLNELTNSQLVDEIKYYLEQVDGNDIYKNGRYVLDKQSFSKEAGHANLKNLTDETLLRILKFVIYGTNYIVNEKGKKITVKALLDKIYGKGTILENQPQSQNSMRPRQPQVLGFGFSGGARKLSKKRSTQNRNRKLLQTHKRSRHKRSRQTSNRKQKRSRQTSNRKLLQTHKRSRHKRSTQTSNRKLLQKQSTHKRSRHKRSRQTSNRKLLQTRRKQTSNRKQKRNRKATRSGQESIV